jgi:hypothetical protein
VLVVGATPAGLVAAVELARRDIAVRVAETASLPDGEITLRPRTQEVLDDLGVRERLLPHATAHDAPRRRRKRWDGQPYRDPITVPVRSLIGVLHTRLAEHGTRPDEEGATYEIDARPKAGGTVFRDGNRLIADHPDHNLAIQDAYNLGWKLAAVLYGAEQELLETYEAERAPTRTQRDAAQTTHYRDSRMSQELGGRRLRIHAGDRVPDLRLWGPEYGDVRLHELLRGPRWTVVGIGSVTAEAVLSVRQRFGDSIRTEVLGGGVGRNLVRGVTLQDRYGDALRLLSKNSGMLLAIRPDGYLGLRSNPDPEIVGAYFEGTLGIWDEAAL